MQARFLPLSPIPRSTQVNEHAKQLTREIQRVTDLPISRTSGMSHRYKQALVEEVTKTSQVCPMRVAKDLKSLYKQTILETKAMCWKRFVKKHLY